FFTYSTQKNGGIKSIVEMEGGAYMPFNDGTYTEDEQGDWFFSSPYEKDKEGFLVIGNTYENPELLSEVNR
ncbi:MAG TPA: YopX family protein, partial [Nitrosopumilaceae archaeon]|nr:YopX family protein [Nitrosopumilaceae archaeon]